MAKTNLDQAISDKATPVLVVALIAGSSFLLGSHIQHKNETLVSETNQAVTTEATAPTNDAISSIEASLNQPLESSPPSSPTAATSTSTKVSNSSTTAAVPKGKVNINTGSQADLERLTGIGATKARAIIDYRNANGPFLRIDDLDKVKGIGPATVEKLRDEATV